MLKVFSTLILTAVCFQQQISASSSSSKNILVTLKSRPAKALLPSLMTENFENRADKINTIVRSVKKFTTDSQENVLKFLNDQRQNNVNDQSFSISSLWTTNQIILKNVNMKIIEQLTSMPEISKIEEEQFIQLINPIEFSSRAEKDEDDFPWGIETINAEKVWQNGTQGQGIIVSIIDTGVRGTHEALRDNFLGDYGWFDPSKKSKKPEDQEGHGTHVIGTIVGSRRNIGVAPAAQWTACKGCGDEGCSSFDLLECGQWVVCPTDTEGNEPVSCDKIPHLVSNSWGGGDEEFYRETIMVWRLAGIIPLFAIGNSGLWCQSTLSPGNLEEVIGVGSTDSTNTVSFFSSAGPTYDGRIKPDVAKL